MSLADEAGSALFRSAHQGSDPDWYAATGHCGGCGEPTCHDGPCVGDYCRKCRHRFEQGLVP